jgi:hypothetical protein
MCDDLFGRQNEVCGASLDGARRHARHGAAVRALDEGGHTALTKLDEPTSAIRSHAGQEQSECNGRWTRGSRGEQTVYRRSLISDGRIVGTDKTAVVSNEKMAVVGGEIDPILQGLRRLIGDDDILFGFVAKPFGKARAEAWRDVLYDHDRSR